MKSLCINRINKDLKEIIKSPLEGIGIISLDNDPFKYVVNIKIMSGVFEGYCIQLLLTFPDNYPIKPPKILIYPGQYFDNTYHHHIFNSDLKDEEGKHFNKFCFDLLENDFLSTSTEHTGWNPSYTISTLLLQVQIFLSKPDFPNGYIPEKEKIEILMKSMDNYERSFKIKCNNNEEVIKIHKWKNPYPEMYFKNDSNSSLVNNSKEDNESNKLKEIKENLTCFISRFNYIDNKNIILGYPIRKFEKTALIPIPEILSYDCFIEESSKFNYRYNRHNRRYTNLMEFNHDLYFDWVNPLAFHEILLNNKYNNDGLFKSANNEFYDNWLPIYINDEHFEKNKTTILNYFSILKYGNDGLKKYDFYPQYIFEIMPTLLSEMIEKMVEKDISSSFLKCFFQYVLMFKKLEKKYNRIFIKYQKFYLEKNFNKLLNLEEDFNINAEILKLYILFLFCDNKINRDIKRKINKYMKNLKNLLLLKLFDQELLFPFINHKLLISDLKKNKLFDKIVDIIFIDSNFLFTDENYLILSEILRNKIIRQMNIDFIGLYSDLDIKIKQKIGRILINKLNILDYIKLDLILAYSNSDILNYNNQDKYNKYQCLFECLREKIFSDNFLVDLEKNYGIYLDSENFVEILKKKIINKSDIIKSTNMKLYDIFDFNDLFFFNAFGKFNKYCFFDSNCDYERNKHNKFDKFPYIKIFDINGHKTFFISEAIANKIMKEKEIYKWKNNHFSKPKKVKINIIKEKLNEYKIKIKNSYNNNKNLYNSTNKKRKNKALFLYRKNNH